ncbi:MAG: hypothetical protein ACOH2L_10715 [Devosia sp.]
MARVNDGAARRRAIATAIAAELLRQQVEAPGLDVDALAQAVDLAFDPPPPIAEGKRPDDLNSTNDD